MITPPPTPQQQKDPLDGKIIYVLIMTVAVQFLYPISVGDSPVRLILYQLFYVSLFVAGIYLVRGERLLRRLLIVASVAWVFVSIIAVFRPSLVWGVTGYLLIIFFQGTLTFVLLRHIFQGRAVTRDILLAAATVYLLLGAIFVPVFGIIETLTWFPEETTHAFFDPQNQAPGEVMPWQTLVYYSYATLTTLGYGDVVPVSYWARSAATFEAVIGVLYTAVIMARLVGLYAGREQQTADRPAAGQSMEK